MHEIVKYLLFTEIQEQCLNPVPATRSGPSRPTEYTLTIDPQIFKLDINAGTTWEASSSNEALPRHERLGLETLLLGRTAQEGRTAHAYCMHCICMHDSSAIIEHCSACVVRGLLCQ